MVLIWSGWVLGAALASEAPSRAVLDDIERWESGQDALIRGPQGCWVLEGQVRQKLTIHQPPDFMSGVAHQEMNFVGTFDGELNDGEWQRWTASVEPEPGTDWEMATVGPPLVGQFPDDGTDGSVTVSLGTDGGSVGGAVAQGVNVLQAAINALSGPTETSLAQWDADQQAVLYLREVAMRDSKHPIAVTTRFPQGEVADRLDAVWPRLMRVGKWPFVAKFRDVQAHVVGYPQGEVVLPWAESMSFTVSAVGFTIGWEQTLAYQVATRCVSASPSPAANSEGPPESVEP